MSNFNRPKPRKFVVRFWMTNWGHGRSVSEEVRGVAEAVEAFVTATKAKYTSPEHEVIVTGVEEYRETVTSP